MDLKKNLPFESYGVKKPIANKLELTASHFRTLRDQQLRYVKGNWWVEYCFRG